MLLVYRRRNLLSGVESMNCRQLYDRLLGMLHFCGRLPDCDVSEGDFPQKLAESVPGIPESEAARMVAAVQWEAYGPENADERETASVRALVRRASEELCSGISWWKKFVFRYGKAYA